MYIKEFFINISKLKRYKYFFLIISYIFLITNSFALDKTKFNIKILDGSSAPDSVIFFNETGDKYSIDQFEGKTILLVFWATWCASCVKEMPDLDVLQKDFRKLPFEIIPVSQDYQGIEVVKQYYINNDIRYLPIYHDFKNELFKAFSIVGIPTSILIDENGKMLMSFIGNVNWHDEEIREMILSRIPGNHPEPKNTYQPESLNQKPKKRNDEPEPKVEKKKSQVEKTIQTEEPKLDDIKNKTEPKKHIKL